MRGSKGGEFCLLHLLCMLPSSSKTMLYSPQLPNAFEIEVAGSWMCVWLVLRRRTLLMLLVAALTV
jgi:hypothetical protein